MTALIGDTASLLGSCIGLSGATTAITFVALGTSLPDTFASMAAAKGDPTADASIGNITGSNSVNVFLGLGLPWVIAVIYETTSNPDNTSGTYRYPAKGLDLSVALFLVCSIIGIFILVSRRLCVGGELGGGSLGRTVSCIVFCSLWVFYVTIASLY